MTVKETVLAIIEEIIGIKDADIEKSFFELGMDSLEVVRLVVEIEAHYNVITECEDTVDIPLETKIKDFISLIETEYLCEIES